MNLQRKHRSRTLALGWAAVSGALVLSACGSGGGDADGAPTSPAQSTGEIRCAVRGDVVAAGSSAQKSAMGQWIKAYKAACKVVPVRYEPTGSGAGVQEFLRRKTSFAGSDAPLAPSETAASQKVCRGGQAIGVPMAGVPIAVGFHVSGVDELTLDAGTLARIFDGGITKWNDSAIAKLNSGAKLPDTTIEPVHRSGESGTTDNFTRYLRTAAPSAWKHAPGTKWPAADGRSAGTSADAAAQVEQTDGAITYVDLADARAKGLKTAGLATGAGDPVPATPDNASRALAAAEVVGTGRDLSLRLDYATKAEGAYPVTMVTYEIVCDRGTEPAGLDAVKSFLGYTASEKGQSGLASAGYAPLPDGIAAKARGAVRSLR